MILGIFKTKEEKEEEERKRQEAARINRLREEYSAEIAKLTKLNANYELIRAQLQALKENLETIKWNTENAYEKIIVGIQSEAATPTYEKMSQYVKNIKNYIIVIETLINDVTVEINNTNKAIESYNALLNSL